VESRRTKPLVPQRNDEGEHGELWYGGRGYGREESSRQRHKLASLAPDYNKVKDEREKERLTAITSAPYLWVRIPST